MPITVCFGEQEAYPTNQWDPWTSLREILQVRYQKESTKSHRLLTGCRLCFQITRGVAKPPKCHCFTPKTLSEAFRWADSIVQNLTAEKSIKVELQDNGGASHRCKGQIGNCLQKTRPNSLDRSLREIAELRNEFLPTEKATECHLHVERMQIILF